MRGVSGLGLRTCAPTRTGIHNIVYTYLYSYSYLLKILTILVLVLEHQVQTTLRMATIGLVRRGETDKGVVSMGKPGGLGG